MAGTNRGTPRRRRMELDTLDRLARVEAPTAYARVPAGVRRRGLEKLHRDLATGKVTPRSDA
jgi:hypothetical protein